MSSYGTYLNLVTLSLFAYQLTGSGLQTGLFMALRLGSGIVAGLAAGILAARHSRRALMIGCDLLSAGAITVLALAPPSTQHLLLYGVAVVLGVTQTQWGVAMRASVPDLVGADRRTGANSQLVTARSVAMLLGFASAGVLVAQWGFQRVFLIDAASYLLCALLLLGVPLGRAARTGVATGPRDDSGTPTPTEAPDATGTLTPTPPGTADKPRRWTIRRWLPAAGAVRAVPALLLAMVAVRSMDAFGSASHNVGLPIYASLISPENPASFAATFLTAWAVGSLAAGAFLSWRGHKREPTRPELTFGIATCLMSVFFVLSFTAPPVWLLVVLAAAAGAADGCAEITYTARLQGVPNDVRAQVLGFAVTAQNTGFGLGMVGCAALLDVFAPFPVVAVAHMAALAAAIGFLVVHIRTVRAGRRRSASRPPTTEVAREFSDA
ncbi:MFS family permease [Micromonospora polyrhachis]|uniref:MFS family permease n=1 Tax=Micromonospora polyrhachis TaxID=1282883 RepID=A0A7W7WSY7_9ACTN|nr:MFS transporter [Micromonospora polyrhachis]MBB4961893.1 MFS family permease [Micromonospora polyrhachis]